MPPKFGIHDHCGGHKDGRLVSQRVALLASQCSEFCLRNLASGLCRMGTETNHSDSQIKIVFLLILCGHAPVDVRMGTHKVSTAFRMA